MTTREFYDLTGGNYGEVIRRLQDEKRVARFVMLFKKDPGFEELEMSLTQGDAASAFRAAHTLKGVCLNLGFDRLFNHVNDVTELLRGGDTVRAQEEMPPLRECYREIIEAIDKLQL